MLNAPGHDCAVPPEETVTSNVPPAPPFSGVYEPWKLSVVKNNWGRTA